MQKQGLEEEILMEKYFDAAMKFWSGQSPSGNLLSMNFSDIFNSFMVPLSEMYGMTLLCMELSFMAKRGIINLIL